MDDGHLIVKEYLFELAIPGQEIVSAQFRVDHPDAEVEEILFARFLFGNFLQWNDDEISAVAFEVAYDPVKNVDRPGFIKRGDDICDLKRI